MTPLPVPPRARMRALVAAAGCAAGALGATHSAAAAEPAGAVLDRTAPRTVVAPEPEARRAQDRLRRELGPRALLAPDPRTGTPRIVARLDGFLSPASPRDAEAVALGYVREHAAAFGLDGEDIGGLRLTARETGPDGTTHLAWEQRAGALPNVDGGLRAAVSAEGRLVNVRGGALPDPAAPAAEPRVSAERAYAVALPGPGAPPAGRTAPGVARDTAFADGARASLVGYRDGATDRLGWRVLIPAGSSAFYDAIVDARTGTLRRRVNRVRAAARITHFDHNPRAENGTPTTSDIPAAWLDGRLGLSGPHVHAVVDPQDTIGLAQSDPPFALTAEPALAHAVLPNGGSGPDRRWDKPPVLGFCGAGLCSWSAANRLANRDFSAAQLFWYLNTFHDHLARAPIGFTAASGGFEGRDRVLAQALDGAQIPGQGFPDADHLNNASMLTLPDGYRPLLTTHLFALGDGRYDAAHDAGVVYHELAHGMTDRLITDNQGFGALSGAQPGAVSEGTSDFYALDFLEAAGELPDTAASGEMRIGHYLQTDPGLRGLTGTLRTQGLDCPVGAPADPSCPGTGTAGPGGYDYADFGRVEGTPEVHADGEIWAQTLWAVRTRLVNDHGPAEGIRRARAYVTGGLRLVPENPTMLDMRNAIVQAAVDAGGGEDWTALWSVFADRGMGWSASTEGAGDVSPFAAGDLPPAPGDPAGRGAVGGTVADETGAPVADATVSVGGHDSGLGATDLAARTGPDGRYALTGVPARRYRDLHVHKPGFQEATAAVDVAAGATTTVDFLPLRRDHASLASGASVASFTGPDFGGQGCGPAQALDDDKGAVWSTEAGGAPQDLVVDLGRSIDVREVRIDPRAGCGDPVEASLARYALLASDGTGQPFEPIAGGTLGAPDARGYVTVPLSGDLAGRRLLLLRAIAPRSLAQGGDPFMDVAELEVTAAGPAGAPLTASTPAATGGLGPGRRPGRAAAASLAGRRLSAGPGGAFKVRVAFARSAPRGKARLVVRSARGRRLAGTSVTVRRGGTVTARLRLNAAGRRAIGRGRARRVRLVLRLPDGARVVRAVRLARAA